MVRLYISFERLGKAQLDLLPDEIGYLIRVRRLGDGDAIEIFDGRGGRWSGILGAGGSRVVLGARVQDDLRLRFTFELWQGLAKGERMEWVIQKATELGVSRIVPLACERSVVKLTASRANDKLVRWRKIAQEAARQSGRADVPEVAEVANLSILTDRARAGHQVVMLYEREAQQALQPFLGRIAAGSHLALVVGPEGGFDPAEIVDVSAAGIPLVGLGDRMLRTETAAVAACVLALAAAGGMGRQEA